MKAIFCIGDSHSVGFSYGFKHRLDAGMTNGFDEWRSIIAGHYFDAQTQRYAPNQAFDDEVAQKLSGADIPAVFLCLAGAEHSFLALGRPWPYDFCMPGDTELVLADGCQLVPFDVMMATCCAAMDRVIAMATRIRSLTDLPLYHILPPPPAAEDELILSRPTKSFDQWLERYGLTPAPIRFKVWRTCLMVARRIYQDLGITVIEPPAEAIVHNGLARQYFSDAVHANIQYGALVADQVISIANGHLKGAS